MATEAITKGWTRDQMAARMRRVDIRILATIRNEETRLSALMANMKL